MHAAQADQRGRDRPSGSWPVAKAVSGPYEGKEGRHDLSDRSARMVVSAAPYSWTSSAKMKLAERIMDEDREMLRLLAKYRHVALDVDICRIRAIHNVQMLRHR